MLHDINGNFKMLNAAGRVTKSRSGFQPVTTEVLQERIARARRRIKSQTSAIRDMTALIENDS
jgi:hypothetical protein